MEIDRLILEEPSKSGFASSPPAPVAVGAQLKPPINRAHISGR